MGSTNCSSCRDSIFPYEVTIQSNKDAIKEVRAARHSLAEPNIIKIQAHLRGYLVKRRVKLLLLNIKQERNSNTQANSAFKNSLNEDFKYLVIKFDEDSLSKLRNRLHEVYKKFFNICQIDLEQSCNESNFNLTNLQTKTGEEFELRNKAVFLRFMKERNRFDIEFLLKSKTIRKEEQSIILEESHRGEMTMEGSINKTFFKQKEEINESQVKERILQIEAQHSKTNLTKCMDLPITPISNNSFLKESKITPILLDKDITYSDSQTQTQNHLVQGRGNSEVSSKGLKRVVILLSSNLYELAYPYFEIIIKSIQEEKSKCSLVKVCFPDSYYEGSFDDKLNCKVGLGLYLKIKENKKKYKYFGYFQKDLFDGVGIYASSNGYLYEGEFRNGRRSGYGFERINESYSYQGFFSDNKFNGYGVYQSFEKKAIYYGTFLNSLKDGLGFIQFSDGSFYSGFWKKNYRSGKGLSKWEEGHTYIGEWVEDKMEGQGTFTWTKGDIFTGSYHNNLRHGNGNYYYKNGSVLQGRWINGKKEGLFSFTANGKPVKVLYKNDVQV